jgi:hypothetical protein
MSEQDEFDGSVVGNANHQLSPQVSNELDRKVSGILQETPMSATEITAALPALHAVVCRFCDFESEDRRIAGSRKTKQELNHLASQIEALHETIDRLSLDAREAVDGIFTWPVFEMSENLLDLTRPVRFRTPSVEPNRAKLAPGQSQRALAPPSGDYIGPVLVTINRLRRAIEPVLDFKGASGRPRRVAWYYLAYGIALHLGEQVTLSARASEGTFDGLLRACLHAGLVTIDGQAEIPDDLREYMYGARRTLAKLDQRQKSSEEPLQK